MVCSPTAGRPLLSTGEPEKLMSFDFIKLYRSTAADNSLKSTQKIVYSLLLALDGKKRNFRSYSTMAGMLGCSRITIIRAINELKKKHIRLEPHGKTSIKIPLKKPAEGEKFLIVPLDNNFTSNQRLIAGIINDKCRIIKSKHEEIDLSGIEAIIPKKSIQKRIGKLRRQSIANAVEKLQEEYEDMEICMHESGIKIEFL